MEIIRAILIIGLILYVPFKILCDIAEGPTDKPEIYE